MSIYIKTVRLLAYKLWARTILFYPWKNCFTTAWKVNPATHQSVRKLMQIIIWKLGLNSLAYYKTLKSGYYIVKINNHNIQLLFLYLPTVGYRIVTLARNGQNTRFWFHVINGPSMRWHKPIGEKFNTPEKIQFSRTIKCFELTCV